MLLVAPGLATRSQTKIKNSASKKEAGGSDRVCGVTANEDVHILW